MRAFLAALKEADDVGVEGFQDFQQTLERG